MKIPSLRMSSIKSTLRKKLGKKSKSAPDDVPSANHMKSTVFESRDDDAYAGSSRYVESVRDCAERDDTYMPVGAGIKVETPVKYASNKIRQGAGVRGKVKELMSPMLRAIALKKKRVPKVSKILKVNARRHQSTEEVAFAELEEAPSVNFDELLTEYSPRSCTEDDDTISCASVEVTGDGIRAIQFTPGSEHVTVEDTDDTEKTGDDDKAVNDTIDKALSEVAVEINKPVAEMEPGVSVSSWSVASLLCMDTESVVESDIKDKNPDERESDKVKIDEDTQITSISPEVIPLSVHADEVVEQANERDNSPASASKASSFSAKTDLPFSNTDSGGILINEISEAHPMPTAPTLSKLPSVEDTNNAEANTCPTVELGVINAGNEADTDNEADTGNAETDANLTPEPSVLGDGSDVDEVVNRKKGFEFTTKASENSAKELNTVTPEKSLEGSSRAAKGKDCEIIRDIEHLFQPSGFPLARTVSDTEVVVMSVQHDGEDIAEAYELVKQPVSWHTVEHQYENSEDVEDDGSNSIATPISDIGKEAFVERSNFNCGLSDGLRDVLLWWGEKVYNACPEHEEFVKRNMVDTARSSEEV